MKNWFVVEEKSWGLLTDFYVYCLLFPHSPSLLQLNEPSSLSFSSQGMCCSPQMFSCFSFTKDPKTECSIPDDINLACLNSLWVQKLKFPWACPRPWADGNLERERERESKVVETLPAFGQSEQFAPGEMGKGLCVYHRMFLPEFWCVCWQHWSLYIHLSGKCILQFAVSFLCPDTFFGFVISREVSTL